MFVISDTHFYHRNIKKYCNRPDGWTETIINNWNNLVDDNDYVIHLGDLSFSNIEKTMEITRRLNGKKYLLKGNHDKRSRKWIDQAGFTLIDKPFIVDCEGFKIVFSHRPKYDLPKESINIHGHIHNKRHFMWYDNDNLYINVSVEKINYSPIRINNLMYMKNKNFSRLII
jgi:calcineurin-like phosphoesterase family protein